MLRTSVYTVIEDATEGAATSATGTSHIIIIITFISILVRTTISLNK